MLPIIAIACCVIVPIVFAAIVGLVSVIIKVVNERGDDVSFHRRLWESLIKG